MKTAFWKALNNFSTSFLSTIERCCQPFARAQRWWEHRILLCIFGISWLSVLAYLLLPPSPFRERLPTMPFVLLVALWLYALGHGVADFARRHGWWGLLQRKALYFTAFTPFVAVIGVITLHVSKTPLTWRHPLWWLLTGQGLAWLAIALHGLFGVDEEEEEETVDELR